MILQLNDLPIAERQNWLQHAIAPRPIGLVSTINREGVVNLAPFSFFNLFSANPPVIIFSPARRIRDNSLKDTLLNLYDRREAVVHIVTEDILQQMLLASCEFPAEVDEFEKAGFTKEKAKFVLPPMVRESHVKFECKVSQIQPLGKEGGAGNLIIAEVLCMHVDEQVLNTEKNMIDQTKLEHVARLGGDWYCRVNQRNLFQLPKPAAKQPIGFAALPSAIRNGIVLTPNDLAVLASVESIPNYPFDFLPDIIMHMSERQLHEYAQEILSKGRIAEAWALLLYSENKQLRSCNETSEDLLNRESLPQGSPL